MSTHTTPQGSARATYLSLVSLGLKIRTDGEKVHVKGVKRLCCAAHAEEVVCLIKQHKPGLIEILTADVSDQDVLAILEEAEY